MRKVNPPKKFTAEQKKKWKEIILHLQAVGTYNTADADVVDLYILAWSDYHQARSALAKQSPVLVSPKTGGEYPSPWIGIKQGAEHQLTRLSSILGLNPQSRRRMKLEDQPLVDPDDDFSEYTD